MDATDEQIPYRYEFTVTPEFRGRVRRALFTQSLLARPIMWILLAAILLVVVFAVIGDVHVSLVTPIFAVIVVVVVFPLVVWSSVSQQVRRNLSDGLILRSGFGEAAFRVSNAAVSATVPISRIAALEPRDDMIWVRLRGPRQRVMYARALFPDDEVARLREMLSSAGSPPPTPGTPA